MLYDAARAVRTVRRHASEWGLQSGRVGVMGSSAGGHLAATLATHYDYGDPEASDPVDRASSRPDVTVLCYPVITMRDQFAHPRSRWHLIGDNPSAQLVDELSAELQVKENTPPAFIWSTWDDERVKVENSLMYASALRARRVRADLHVYETEKQAHGVGFGLGQQGSTNNGWHPWTHDLLFWLHERRLAHRTATRSVTHLTSFKETV